MTPSMKRALKALWDIAAAFPTSKHKERHAAVTQVFDNLRPKTYLERNPQPVAAADEIVHQEETNVQA